MSGGSYNYLCYTDGDTIWNNIGNLSDMSARLAGLGYADDAARETEELLVMMRQARNRIETRIKRLSDVWRAVEWWDSGDSGEDHVRLALARYRAELEPVSAQPPAPRTHQRRTGVVGAGTGET